MHVSFRGVVRAMIRVLVGGTESGVLTSFVSLEQCIVSTLRMPASRTYRTRLGAALNVHAIRLSSGRFFVHSFVMAWVVVAAACLTLGQRAIKGACDEDTKATNTLWLTLVMRPLR